MRWRLKSHYLDIFLSNKYTYARILTQVRLAAQNSPGMAAEGPSLSHWDPLPRPARAVTTRGSQRPSSPQENKQIVASASTIEKGVRKALVDEGKSTGNR